MHQFFVTAIAEKVSALKTEAYFRERRERGDLAGYDVWLAASPDREPEAGDELPWSVGGHAHDADLLRSGSACSGMGLDESVHRTGRTVLGATGAGSRRRRRSRGARAWSAS
jgi:hypothetical protein